MATALGCEPNIAVRFSVGAGIEAGYSDSTGLAAFISCSKTTYAPLNLRTPEGLEFHGWTVDWDDLPEDPLVTAMEQAS